MYDVPLHARHQHGQLYRPGSVRCRPSPVAGLNEDEIACISAITEAEIRYGLAKRPEATALKLLMDGFLASIRILPWGRDEAQAYGVLRAKLEASGISLGNMDIMIAAHAVTSGAVLVTNDKALGQTLDLHASSNWATDL